MGRKRLPKWNPVFFHLAIGIGVMALLFSCQAVGPLGPRASHKEPGYETAFQYLERVQQFMNLADYESALSENAKLESYYDYKESRSRDYDRVIRVSARMNTILLKKIIQDEKKIPTLSKQVHEQEDMLKKLNVQAEKMMQKSRELDSALKTVERLDSENAMLRQQIKDFKKIDLEGHEIKADM